jgi:dehydrogenase/reductase SDR family member 12
VNPFAARVVDQALEVTVAGSFTRVGYEVRRRAFGWPGQGPDLSGRTVLVTGATSGLGRAAAFALAGSGADVVLLGRDRQRTEAAAGAVRAATRGAHVDTVVADLANLAEVRGAAAELALRLDGLDALINNAGALTHGYTVTGDGLELTYQTHVVAPFLLTHLLLPLLQARPGSRVITVSSGGMYAEPLRFPVAMASTEYDGVRAYARAKRAQVVLNVQWAERVAAPPTFHAMHPGWADTPGVVHSLPTFHRVVGRFLRTPEEGADTIVWLAGADEAAGTDGLFWLDRRPRGTDRLPWTRSDDAAAQRLWDLVSADAGLISAPAP